MSVDFAGMTVPELEELAREAEVPGYYKMRKAELIKALAPKSEKKKRSKRPLGSPAEIEKEAPEPDLSLQALECLGLFQDAEKADLTLIDLPYRGDDVVAEVEKELSHEQRLKICWGQTGRRTAIG